MELVLTEAEHKALPEDRQTGTKRDDGSFVIAIEGDPIADLATVTQERDAANTAREEANRARDTAVGERDTARRQAQTAVAEQRGTARKLKEYSDIGDVDEFRTTRERWNALPEDVRTPPDPAVTALRKEMKETKTKMAELEREREEAKAAANRERMVGKLRDVAQAAGLRSEPMAMEALTVLMERRGLSEDDDGALMIGPENGRKKADEAIAEIAKDGAVFLFGQSTSTGVARRVRLAGAGATKPIRSRPERRFVTQPPKTGRMAAPGDIGFDVVLV